MCVPVMVEAAGGGNPQIPLSVPCPTPGVSLVAHGKESVCNAEEGWIPGSGRPPGEGNDNPLQYSCLENSLDRGAWQAIVHGVAKS